jgi:hypothetical protein
VSHNASFQIGTVFGRSLIGLLIGACSMPPALGGAAVNNTAQTQNRASLTAQVMLASAVPVDLVKTALDPAQRAADDASRRRGIDFFTLHANPVGMRLRSGTAEATILSFLGTSKDRTDLNIELRALLGAGSPGIVMNYSGPVTLGNRAWSAPAATLPTASRTPGLRFTLLTGSPGNGIAETYGEFLGHMGEQLRQRYGADRFAFDDVPLIFAAGEADTPAGFVFCNQGSRLVLGERKYADVQAVTAYDPAGKMLANYVLVGFNPKTVSVSQVPTYRTSQDARFGSVIEFGEH